MKDNRNRLFHDTVISRKDAASDTYVIASEYGAGGSAIVYRAKAFINGQFSRDVLIKELFPVNGYIRDDAGFITTELPGMQNQLDDYEEMMWVEHRVGSDIIRDDPWAASIEAP